MDLKEVLPGVLAGLGLGTFFYVIGGVAAPYFTGVNAPVIGALGFLVGTGIGITKALK